MSLRFSKNHAKIGVRSDLSEKNDGLFELFLPCFFVRVSSTPIVVDGKSIEQILVFEIVFSVYFQSQTNKKIKLFFLFNDKLINRSHQTMFDGSLFQKRLPHSDRQTARVNHWRQVNEPVDHFRAYQTRFVRL